MSKEQKTTLSPDWAQEKLTSLHQELVLSGKWPETADRLWFDLVSIAQDSNVEGDNVMFSIVVNDALQGIDIAQRYPVFYRKMLANPALFQAFLEVIEVIEEERAGILETPSIVDESNIAILPVTSTLPTVEHPKPGWWSISWRQTREQLQALFALLGPSMTLEYRSDRLLLEESSIPLVQGEAEIEDKHLEVLLAASRIDDLDALKLLLTVVIQGQESPETPAIFLQATVQWGSSYSKTVAVAPNGQATFPPLPLQAITDETGQDIIANLEFILEPAQ